jgi:hypothetical protein
LSPAPPPLLPGCHEGERGHSSTPFLHDAPASPQV